ncbi:MAG: preprotein translocase subunit SecG [Myxococcaceae bacterium]
MLIFFSTVHIVLCLFLIFVILLQPGKDAGMGAALGGGAATSAFGGRGAVTVLSKITAVCAGLFFVTSLGLSFAGLRTSVIETDESSAAPPAASAPAVPAATNDAPAAGTPLAPVDSQAASSAVPPAPATATSPKAAAASASTPVRASPKPAAPAPEKKP